MVTRSASGANVVRARSMTRRVSRTCSVSVSCVRGVGPALADEAFDVVTEPGQVDVADVEPLAVGL